MASKVIQLTFPGFEDKEKSFEEIVVSSMRSLFAKNSAREKELKHLWERNEALEEIVFRMSGKIDRIFSEKNG